ncbi:MAG: hypothetical protein WC615_05825 [Mucilaginibacter sp.]|jgi:hypothetical protein|uniref:hypothetical protein n=1 Tax=Mucilaginibacter sp. TaxID=1882438 RepID=UPI003565D786
MAQMEFYFNDDDRKELFNFIQLKGGKFIPDVGYETDNYIIIADCEEFMHYQRSETTHFFLIDAKYSLEPLQINRNKYIDKPAYFIDQRIGGPYIDFSFYRGYSDDAVIPFMKSLIEMYPKFIHFDSSQEFKATIELKGYYNEIMLYIKNKCNLILIGKKKYWISINVQKEIGQD